MLENGVLSFLCLWYRKGAQLTGSPVSPVSPPDPRSPVRPDGPADPSAPINNIIWGCGEERWCLTTVEQF